MIIQKQLCHFCNTSNLVDFGETFWQWERELHRHDPKSH